MASNQIKKVKTFGIGGIALATVLGSILVIYPFFNEAETLKLQVAEKTSENSILLTRIDMLKNVSSQVPEIKSINDSLSTRFPATSDIPGLVSSLGAVATSVGLGSGSFTSIETSIPVIVADTAAALPSAGDTTAPTGPVDNTDTGAGAGAGGAPSTTTTGTSNLASMTVTISIEGSPDQLSNFVKNLSGADGRAFLIKSFNIDSSGTEGLSKLTLETTTFLYRTLPDPVVEAKKPATPAVPETPSTEPTAPIQEDGLAESAKSPVNP